MTLTYNPVVRTFCAVRAVLVNDFAIDRECVRPAVPLTAREYDLLVHLMAQPGVTFGREQLLREVWGWEFGDTSTVTVHVRRLREKLEEDPADPALLATVWGVGYRWAGT